VNPALWHYTCDHGHQGISKTHGVLLAAVDLVPRDRADLVPWVGDLVWLTDLRHPNRAALGLTSHLIKCDRTVHRYRVIDDTHCERWVDYAHRLRIPMAVRADVERATPGNKPIHWWVSECPVPVEYDPERVPVG
jgi:hypothetical protein